MAHVAYSWDEDSAETHEMLGKPRPSRGAWTTSSSGSDRPRLDDSGEQEVDDRAPTRAVRPVRQIDLEDEVTVIREAPDPRDHTHVLSLHAGEGVSPRATLPYGAPPHAGELALPPLPPPPRPMVARGLRIAGPASPPGNIVPPPPPPISIGTIDPTPGPTSLPTLPQQAGPRLPIRWPAIGAVMGALSLFLTVMVGVLLLLPQRGDLRIELTAPGGGQVSRAEIFVDGQKRCDSAPCIVSELPAGPRMVKVIAPGYGEATTTTEVVEVGRERIALVSLQGASADALAAMRVQSTQPGVRVLVDGVDRGELPVRLTDLAPGAHKLTFEGERYEPTERTVDLAAGQTKDLGAVTLKVRRGRLTVELATPGATVLLTRIGADAARTEKVLPGPWPMAVELDASSDWRVTASLRGHTDAGNDVSFSDGQPEKRVRIELQRAETAAAAVPVEAIAAVAPPPASLPGAPVTGVRCAARPQPQPSSPAPPAGGSGMLNVNSLPASKVLVDGRALGETPKVDIALPAGVHTVTFVHPDHGRKTVTVTVRAGQTATAAVRFKK
jgi:serine/threonine-protein kinase